MKTSRPNRKEESGMDERKETEEFIKGEKQRYMIEEDESRSRG